MRTLKPGSNSFSFHAVLGQVGMIGFLLLVFYEGQGLSHAAFGALGLGVGLSNILFAIAAGLISVQEAFVSWAIGGDKKQVALDWFNPFLVVSFVCALILASVMILAPLCVHYFIHDQRMAKECIIIFPGLAIALLFQILFHCFRNYLQSAGLPQLTSTVLWLGNLFFLAIARFYGPETDVDPTVRIVTLTICSRLFMLALIFVFSKAQLDISGFPNFRANETAKYFALLKLGLPASAQTLLEGGLFFLIFVFAAQLDAKSLGLQSVVANLVNFIFAIPYGISASSSNEVGRALGRTQGMEAIRIGWRKCYITLGIMTALSLAWITFGADVLHFAFNQSLALPLQAMSLVIGCFQIADGLQIVLTGVLRGFGDTKSALWANALGHWVVGLPLAYALGVYKQMGLVVGACCRFLGGGGISNF